jgi:phosphoribosylformylglycinamidine synthase
MEFRGRVEIRLKSGIDDPEGRNTLKALRLLGFEGIKSISASRVFDFKLEAADEKECRTMLENACEKLLANPVIHNYTIQLEPVPGTN